LALHKLDEAVDQLAEAAISDPGAAAASWALSCLVLRAPVSGGVFVPGRRGPVLI
jgi:hypothetical protein